MTAFVDPQKYLAYLSVMTVLCWVPGPANLFSVANGARRGPRSAMIGVLGMNLGTLVWFMGAALGLGALVAAVPMVFKGMAILGALYVAWLGVQSLWSARRKDGADTAHGAVKLGRSPLLDGFVVQLSNPKALLFFTAVLPPFIDLKRPLQPQLLAFAAGVIVMDAVSMTTYGLSGAALARRMQQPTFRRVFSAVVGLVLIGAAGLIASRA
jgi:threonine/homoserine/homoserine lactone efflux protein